MPIQIRVLGLSIPFGLVPQWLWNVIHIHIYQLYLVISSFTGSCSENKLVLLCEIVTSQAHWSSRYLFLSCMYNNFYMVNLIFLYVRVKPSWTRLKRRNLLFCPRNPCTPSQNCFCCFPTDNQSSWLYDKVNGLRGWWKWRVVI